jgi:hypothetical protein
MTLPDNGLLLGLAVALGGGLLIGLERERRKGEGPTRRAAGIRSFALVALAGAWPGAGAAGKRARWRWAAGLAYGFDRWRATGLPPTRPPDTADPGMTTELALW